MTKSDLVRGKAMAVIMLAGTGKTSNAIAEALA
jgi:hypothetical protein